PRVPQLPVRAREPLLEPRDLLAERRASDSLVGRRARSERNVSPNDCRRRHRYPPIGALGFAPQKSCVPSMLTKCTPTMVRTIDWAVALPTPTGPPLALYP